MNPPEKNNYTLPTSIRIIMEFIDRVGFPILAFLLMFYLCYVTINKNTQAIEGMKQSNEVRAEVLEQLIAVLKGSPATPSRR